MRALTLLLIATCTVLFVEADEEKQRLQKQPLQGPPQRPSEDEQQGPSQNPWEDQQAEPQIFQVFQPPQQEQSPEQFEGPSQGPFQQRPPQVLQKEGNKEQRPGHQGPRPGEKGPRPGHQGPRPGYKGPHPGYKGPRPIPPQPLFNNFTTPQLNAIVNRFLREGGRLTEKFGDRRNNEDCTIDQIRTMFFGYNMTLKMLQVNFTACITDDMKALPEKAMREILSCLPDMETKKNESKAAFDALLKTLTEADKEISALSCDAQKQIKVSQIEWSDVYQFYVNKAGSMFEDLQQIQSCVSPKRAAIQEEVTKFLEELQTCAQQ